MIVILDTNVLVSAAMRAGSGPALIVERALNGEFQICCDSRILAEYRAVMSRPKFGFDPVDVQNLIEGIDQIAIHVVCQPLPEDLPDPDDKIFLEAAIAGKADYLITGNLRHYPEPQRHGVVVLTPREFLDLGF